MPNVRGYQMTQCEDCRDRRMNGIVIQSHCNYYFSFRTVQYEWIVLCKKVKMQQALNSCTLKFGLVAFIALRQKWNYLVRSELEFRHYFDYLQPTIYNAMTMMSLWKQLANTCLKVSPRRNLRCLLSCYCNTSSLQTYTATNANNTIIISHHCEYYRCCYHRRYYFYFSPSRICWIPCYFNYAFELIKPVTLTEIHECSLDFNDFNYSAYFKQLTLTLKQSCKEIMLISYSDAFCVN